MSPTEQTRRQFLETTAAAGTASALSPVLPAAGQSTAARSTNEAAGKNPMDKNSAEAVNLRLEVNGSQLDVTVEPRISLLDVLREHLDLTGTKKGCNQGACGACTVLLDGRRANSCLTLAMMAQGAQITTIEGLAGPGGELHPVQRAFIEHDAFQCGYCTPGQIMSAVALVGEVKANQPSYAGHGATGAVKLITPISDDEIRERMSGNICRCGAYPNIVAAVRQALGEVA